MTALELTSRWGARVVGVLLVATTVFFVIGHGGVPNLRNLLLPEKLEFSGMFLMLGGYLLGWKWEVVGGAMAIGGYLLFNLTELVVNGSFAGGAIPLFAIPGGLFLLAAYLGRVNRQRLNEPGEPQGRR